MSDRLVHDVRALLERTRSHAAGSPLAADVDLAIARLDGPLRVAFAGKIKAGKSTLLNALVGEPLAPTDAGECTKVVSWYQNGLGYRVSVHPVDGSPVTVPFSRRDGALEIDLQGRDPAGIARLVVEWPSSTLADLTLIDTPGIASLSTDVSARAHAFLAPDDERETDADAVIYLMRHLHASDRRFLESFHDQEASQPSPVNTIGVLSRADEIGVGRIDAMVSASKIASRYRGDPQIRRLCQTVLPVAGLIAEAAATLREAEYRALHTLASQPHEETERLLISVDRFTRSDDAFGLLPIEREHLVLRLGLFGVRLAIALIRDGQAPTASELAILLSRHSGVEQLRYQLDTVFRQRRTVLKARAGLLALRNVLLRLPDEALEGELERIVANAHEIAELRLLNQVRSGHLGFDEATDALLERVVGAAGTDPRTRLELPHDADAGAVRATALERFATWRTAMEHPLTTRAQADALQIATASLERIIASVAAT